jgi:hypothetical protein
VASREYIDFLANYGGYDGMLLQLLWQNNPSEPVLVAHGYFPVYRYMLPMVIQ